VQKQFNGHHNHNGTTNGPIYKGTWQIICTNARDLSSSQNVSLFSLAFRLASNLSISLEPSALHFSVLVLW
jgi:hypothetical protein